MIWVRVFGENSFSICHKLMDANEKWENICIRSLILCRQRSYIYINCCQSTCSESFPLSKHIEWHFSNPIKNNRKYQLNRRISRALTSNNDIFIDATKSLFDDPQKNLSFYHRCFRMGLTLWPAYGFSYETWKCRFFHALHGSPAHLSTVSFPFALTYSIVFSRTIYFASVGSVFIFISPFISCKRKINGNW